MTKKIALKIDVDTQIGAQKGVPALLQKLAQYGAHASFFCALGPDKSGREKKGDGLKSFYPFSTRLYGTLLPAPIIANTSQNALADIATQGHEAGLHGWNRVLWEQQIVKAHNTLIETELCRASAAFEKIFGRRPLAHASPGWLINRHALRLTQRLGFHYSSDTRGDTPFIPVIEGEIVLCPQIPTTLPTLDELMQQDPAMQLEEIAKRLLQLSSSIPGDHVFTLRAELEGIKFIDFFDQLLFGWKNLNFELVPLKNIAEGLDIMSLPRHVVTNMEIPGRLGARTHQGNQFLA